MDYNLIYFAYASAFLMVSVPFNGISKTCIEDYGSKPGGTVHLSKNPNAGGTFKLSSPEEHAVGRHVCQYDRIVMKPYEEIQSYCKPKYVTYFRKCDGNIQGFCAEHRLVYEQGHRSVQRMVPETEKFFACCPGWSKTRPLARGCRKAICSRECENGGSCIKPNQCACSAGWMGKFCQKDIDECKRETSLCEQICINWPGSYKCSCQDGFELQPDGKTCERTMKASTPDLSVIQYYEKIDTKIADLEEQFRLMDDLNQRVRMLTEDIEYLKNQTEEDRRKSEEHGLGRLHSLSEQMAIIEERLAECSCNSPLRAGPHPPPR